MLSTVRINQTIFIKSELAKTFIHFVEANEARFAGNGRLNVYVDLRDVSGESHRTFGGNLDYFMALEIAFLSRELRATCESPTRAKRELGDLASRALRRQLADMEAAETVAELFQIGLGIEDCEHTRGVLRFCLGNGLYLCCKVNHQNIPMIGEMVDWSRVTRLKVAQIGSNQ